MSSDPNPLILKPPTTNDNNNHNHNNALLGCVRKLTSGKLPGCHSRSSSGPRGEPKTEAKPLSARGRQTRKQTRMSRVSKCKTSSVDAHLTSFLLGRSEVQCPAVVMFLNRNTYKGVKSPPSTSYRQLQVGAACSGTGLTKTGALLTCMPILCAQPSTARDREGGKHRLPETLAPASSGSTPQAKYSAPPSFFEGIRCVFFSVKSRDHVALAQTRRGERSRRGPIAGGCVNRGKACQQQGLSDLCDRRGTLHADRWGHASRTQKPTETPRTPTTKNQPANKFYGAAV